MSAVSIVDAIEACFVIECSRCSVERVSYADYKTDAADDFAGWGWVHKPDGRTYCSGCA